MKRFAILFAVVLVAVAAGATPITAGGSGAPTTLAPSGTLLATLIQPVNPLSQTYTGSLISAVYRTPGGTLDFYYQFTNLSGNDEITRITMNPFGAFTTDAYYSTSAFGPFAAGTETPFDADRAANGNVVGFDFTGGNLIGTGETSAILIVRTDAYAYTNGFASVIDGGATTVYSYAPAPVPEPGSLLMFGSGLIGVAGMLRRRFFN